MKKQQGAQSQKANSARFGHIQSGNMQVGGIDVLFMNVVFPSIQGSYHKGLKLPIAGIWIPNTGGPFRR